MPGWTRAARMSAAPGLADDPAPAAPGRIRRPPADRHRRARHRGRAAEAPPEKPLTGIERLVAAGVLTFREVNLGLARAWSEPQPAAPEKSAPRIPAFPLTDPPRRFDTQGVGRPAPVPAGRFRPGRPGRGGERPPSLPPHPLPESRPRRPAPPRQTPRPPRGAAKPGFKVNAGRVARQRGATETAACRLRQGKRAEA
jgi:hypothetical protein